MKKILFFSIGVVVGFNLFGIATMTSIAYHVGKDAAKFIDKEVI